MPLLDIKNLSVRFDSPSGEVHAVKGTSFHVEKGETLGIVGESGSGKSVSSLAIMGLLHKTAKTEGEIVFEKKGGEKLELSAASNKDFLKIRGTDISMIFQDPMSSLNPVFRCGRQVEEAFLVGSQKSADGNLKNQVLRLFEQVNLNDPERIYHSFPHQLSGGQRQRVMIAMALANNPSLLIADEPTSALDVTVQRSILQLLKELKTTWGGSIIFISHDLHVVAEVADRILVMQKGEIVEEGEAEDVLNNPKHEYTQRLVADFNRDFDSGSEAENGKPPLFKVENLTTLFPSKKNFFGKPLAYVHAVDGVSFEIKEGETFGLVGESGSGKTTLGRSIVQLEMPTSGEVYFGKQNLTQLTDNQLKSFRKEIQIIFQDPYSSLNPLQPIGLSIVEPMRVHGIGQNEKERREKAVALLEEVGLEASHFWRLPKAFSGGQRQRICIARALALEPRFIVCDECVSALDVTVQAQVLELLARLKKERNLTYLFISHDLNVVRQISDRIAVMKGGKIVEMGEAEKVFTNPEHEYTQKLLGGIG